MALIFCFSLRSSATTTRDEKSPHSQRRLPQGAERLYRYSANKTYYAVFKMGGKRIWKSVKANDWELAKRKLKDELEKRGKVDPHAGRMSLAELLVKYEECLNGLAEHTRETRQSILKKF